MPTDMAIGWQSTLVVAFWGVAGLFWLWMLLHCLRMEPDRHFWLTILLLFPPSVLVYFITRFLPENRTVLPVGFRRWALRSELDRLRRATLQIGNPYHFIQYGEALRSVGLIERAETAFQSALDREPSNLAALWGAAQCAVDLGRLGTARELLERAVGIDPEYKFGDVSLALARVLLATGERTAARHLLQQHVHRWRTSEGQCLLAQLLAECGEVDRAREILQALLIDLHGADRRSRSDRVCLRTARKLLKSLPT